MLLAAQKLIEAAICPWHIDIGAGDSRRTGGRGSNRRHRDLATTLIVEQTHNTRLADNQDTVGIDQGATDDRATLHRSTPNLKAILARDRFYIAVARHKEDSVVKGQARRPFAVVDIPKLHASIGIQGIDAIAGNKIKFGQTARPR